MAELGDLLGEWHKAKPPEKLLIVGISIAAIGIAVYIHSKTSTSTTPTNPVGGTAGTPGTIATGGTPSNGQPVPPGTPTPTPPKNNPVDPPVKPHSPTGNTPPPKPKTQVFKAQPVRGGTLVVRTAARPRTVAAQFNTRYRNQWQGTYTPPTTEQWNNRYRDQSGQTYRTTPAPINPTKAQVITHLQNQRRMPS